MLHLWRGRWTRVNFRKRADGGLFDSLISTWSSCRLLPDNLWATLPGKWTVIHRFTPVKGLVPKSKSDMPPASANGRGWQGHIMVQDIVACEVL